MGCNVPVHSRFFVSLGATDHIERWFLRLKDLFFLVEHGINNLSSRVVFPFPWENDLQ